MSEGIFEVCRHCNVTRKSRILLIRFLKSRCFNAGNRVKLFQDSIHLQPNITFFEHKAPSTLMRFRLKTRILFYPFSPSVHTNTIENGGVCLRKRRFSVFVWTGENGGFRKRFVTGIGMSQFHLCVTKTDVFLSIFGGQVWTVENAAKTLVWTKNVLSVFKKQKTEVFENALVCSIVLIVFNNLLRLCQEGGDRAFLLV